MFRLLRVLAVTALVLPALAGVSKAASCAHASDACAEGSALCNTYCTDTYNDAMSQATNERYKCYAFPEHASRPECDSAYNQETQAAKSDYENCKLSCDENEITCNEMKAFAESLQI